MLTQAPEDTWYRIAARRCWVRADQGTFQLFDKFSDAEAYAASVRPAVQVQQSRRIGDLDVALESAWSEPDPNQPDRWHLVLGVRVTNRGSGDYEYDFGKSLRLSPAGMAPEGVSAWTPGLTSGRLKKGQSATGFVSFALDTTAAVSAVHFQALGGSSSKGDIPLVLKLGSDYALVAAAPTPATQNKPASAKTQATALASLAVAPIDGACPTSRSSPSYSRQAGLCF